MKPFCLHFCYSLIMITHSKLDNLNYTETSIDKIHDFITMYKYPLHRKTSH